MQRVREFWNAFRNFAIIFSFIMNFVLVIVLLFVMYLLFDIKNGIAEPLVDGLHRNFVGLDEAVIERTIIVEDTIPISFDLLVEDTTEVTLAEPAEIQDVPAVFAISGGGGTITGAVDITLPAGTPLTITLVLPVPVEQEIPILLPVDVQIPLNETALSLPFNNLKDLFDPYVRALDNLPDSWSEMDTFMVDALNGEVDLLRETEGSRNPWPGPDAQLIDTAGDADSVPIQHGQAPVTAPDGDGATGQPDVMPTPTLTPFPTPTITPQAAQ
jgi:hypothetical protein